MKILDQLGYEIEIAKTPKRIISLVPSQTEYLFDLGLDDHIVGVTQFCVHPEDKVHAKQKIGGTKRFLFDRIDALKPDFIIGNKEENYQEGIQQLTAKYPVWMSDIKNLSDAYEMMLTLGKILNKSQISQSIVAGIQQAFATLKKMKAMWIAYLIWRKPYMAVGSDTFINEMLLQAGFINIFAHRSRYPQIDLADLQSGKPELILLSSEPYPFTEKHFSEFQITGLNAKTMVVDGQLFSWYGSRLQYAPAYFERLRELIS